MEVTDSHNPVAPQPSGAIPTPSLAHQSFLSSSASSSAASAAPSAAAMARGGRGAAPGPSPAEACHNWFTSLFQNTSVLVCLIPCSPPSERGGRWQWNPIAVFATFVWIAGAIVMGCGVACHTGAAGDACGPGTGATVMIAVGACLFAWMPLLCFVGCCCQDDYD